jgi:hypothetical protein
MPAILREVLKTNTFEQKRQIINTLAQDFVDYVDGSGFSSKLRLQDGASDDLALFFNSDPGLGFYKSLDNQLTFTSDYGNVVDFSDSKIQLYKKLYYQDAEVETISLTEEGSYYPAGSFTNVPTTNISGSGSGLTVDLTIAAFDGQVTNSGSNYLPGQYNFTFTNVDSSGSNGTAIAIVSGIDDGTFTAGSGYAADQTFTAVPLIGGSGSGALATLVVNGSGQIASVAITNEGNGAYQTGDILTVNNSSLTYVDGNGQSQTSGGSGFSYTVPSGIYQVIQVNPPASWSGTGYLPGDIVSGSFGGGSGFTYIFTKFGFISSVSINQLGSFYTLGTKLTPVLNTGSGAEFNITLGEPIERATIDPLGNALFQNIVNAGSFSTATATVSSSLTVQNLTINGTVGGTATISANSLNIGGSITAGGNGSFGGNLTVSGSSNPSAINGDVSFNGNLFQIDNTNDRVSINGPTGATIEDYLFQVHGIQKIFNNLIVAVESGSGVSIGEDPGVGVSPSEKLVVTGNARFTGNINVGDGLLAAPSISFATDSTLGFYKKANNQIGFSAYNGDMATFSATAINFYKPLELIDERINDFSISPGQGFVPGDYTNVILNGGTGADFTISYVVAFTGTISEAGSGYTSALYTNIPLTGGSGTSATANILVEGGSVTEVSVTDNGDGLYEIGDVLSANDVDMVYVDENGDQQTSTVPSVPFSFTITALNSVSNVEIVDFGAGYSVGDNLSLPNEFFDLSLRAGYYQFSPNLPVAANDKIYSFSGNYVYNVQSAGTLGSSDPKFGKNAVTSIDIVSGGSGYPASATINSVSTTTTSGIGSGLKVNITTNSSGVITSITPEDTISGINYTVLDTFTLDDTAINTAVDEVSISSQGTGTYEPDRTYSNLAQSSTSGSGTGAVFSVTANSGGDISSITIVSGGTGYAIGDTITIDGTTFGPDSQGNEAGTAVFLVTSLTSGSGASFSVASVASSASSGDTVLEWYDYKPSGFNLQITDLQAFSNIQFNSVDGLITTKALNVSPDGVTIGDTLKLNNNTISSTAGNILLSAESNSQVVVTGTNALGVPSGSTAQRPVSAPAGSIRFNTDESRFEGFNGSFFVSLGGVRDVDGNTFISAELNAGDNDNTLWFFNDNILSLRVTQTQLNLESVNNFTKYDLTGVAQWVSEGTALAATLPEISYVYYGDNVYSIDTSGTFGTVPPTHTLGTEVNGDVDLTWVRTVYGNLSVRTKNANFITENELRVNSTSLVINDVDTNEIKLKSAKEISLGFNPTSPDNYQLLKLNNTGQISVNTLYGSGSSSYVNILDNTLKSFELLDTKLVSNSTQLDSSVSSSVEIVLSPWNTSVSGKILVEIEEQFDPLVSNSNRQYSEISYLVSGEGDDIFYTETNKLYTNILLGDLSISLDSSSTPNIVVEFATSTGSTTALYNIKVISQLIKR